MIETLITADNNCVSLTYLHTLKSELFVTTLSLPTRYRSLSFELLFWILWLNKLYYNYFLLLKVSCTIRTYNQLHLQFLQAPCYRLSMHSVTFIDWAPRNDATSLSAIQRACDTSTIYIYKDGTRGKAIIGWPFRP